MNGEDTWENWLVLESCVVERPGYMQGWGVLRSNWSIACSMYEERPEPKPRDEVLLIVMVPNHSTS